MLAFQILTYSVGGTLGFLRFSIVTVPLAVCLVGSTDPGRGRWPLAGPGCRLGPPATSGCPYGSATPPPGSG